MRKLIINPVKCDVGYNGAPRFRNAFAKIGFSDDGRLSISGVIAPLRNGDCSGSAGQCVDEIRKGVPTEDWSPEMLQKFCDIWEEWHLNDARPECEHQRKLGWREQAREQIVLYHYILNDDAIKEQKNAEKAAMDALKNGEAFTPTPEQTMYASMKYFYNTYKKIEDDSKLSRFYKPYNSYTGTPAEEAKTRGWVYYTGKSQEWGEESPLGLLCKPCPVCDYEYGHGHKKVEVPQDIIDWLFGLPETKVTPAWI